jgi:hypothetical protein
VDLIRRPRIHATGHAADPGRGVPTEDMGPKHQRPRMLKFFSDKIDMSEPVDRACRLDKKKLMTLLDDLQVQNEVSVRLKRWGALLE